MKIKVDTVYSAVDEAIESYDPEMADMGNPSGAIYGKRIYTFACTAEGRRFCHQHVFETEDGESASQLVERVKAAGEIDLTYWVETYEIYGSSAWQREDDRREEAWRNNPNTSGSVRDV